MTQKMLIFMALLTLIPIAMIVLSLIMTYPSIKWLNIIAAIGLFIFNLFGLATYPRAYYKFLIIVGLGFNVPSIWYAWNWI